jgi:hypothetical protein
VHEEDEGGGSNSWSKIGGTQKQEREMIKKGRDHVFHTIVQETIATKEFEAEKKQENETRWMEIRAMEMHKVVIEERLRVLEEELQMKKVEQKMQDYVHGHTRVLLFLKIARILKQPSQVINFSDYFFSMVPHGPGPSKPSPCPVLTHSPSHLFPIPFAGDGC